MYHCKVNIDISCLRHLTQCFQMNNVSQFKDLIYWVNIFYLIIYFNYLFTKIVDTRCTDTHIRSDLLYLGTSNTYKHFI